MNNGLYAVRDNVAGTYFPPFMAVNNAVAVRSFINACGNPGSPLHDNPNDFDLYKLADYDQVNGIITPIDKLIIARGTEETNFEV